MNKKELSHRLGATRIRHQADAYRDEVRKRLIREGPTNRNREAANNASWEQMWEVFEPSVKYHEQQQQKMRELKEAKEDREDIAPPQLQGMPERTTNDILDPEYAEKDPGKQLRDGLLWAALEFDRVIEDTDKGPVAHLNDASTPPPNAFAIGTLRTYALSPTEKRRDLIGRALGFATKAHDTPIQEPTSEGGFLHEIL